MKIDSVKWVAPKHRQPVWKIFRFVFRPFFLVKNVEFVDEKFPEKCILISNHNNKKGPMVFEFSLPIKHATWGAYQMLGTYKMRFRYLRDVLYIQKNNVKKGKATFKAMIESLFSLFTYRGMKVIPSYPDVRFMKTMQYSMECLDNGFAVSLYPEDSNQGYFDEMTHFFSGFVMFSEQYFKKTGEDLPIFPIWSI